MNQKFEKILVPIVWGLMLLEAIISFYLLYTMSGIWITAAFVVLLIIVIFFTVWAITSIYETADMFKQSEQYATQHKASTAAFYRISSIVFWFPLRAIILYFVYMEFEHGVLYILLYLLFLNQKTRAALDITSKIADESYFKNITKHSSGLR